MIPDSNHYYVTVDQPRCNRVDYWYRDVVNTAFPFL